MNRSVVGQQVQLLICSTDPAAAASPLLGGRLPEHDGIISEPRLPSGCRQLNPAVMKRHVTALTLKAKRPG
ncbi:hypothetical protein PBY51_018556 [Eleginops maclovinus]|nr:hypothetical protein PBY51_018556 [Eleginops maclovinus]